MNEKRRINPHKPKIRLPIGKKYLQIKEIVHKHNLHTICESGYCPNLSECWGNGTSTIMILGNICTRACKFCSVPSGKPLPPDNNEPKQVAEAVKIMHLSHCVITSVDRDDLPDFGASYWAETVRQIRLLNPETTIETLIPDFNFDKKALDKIIDVHPEIISHNVETVQRLTPQIRSRAKYIKSLKVLKYLHKNGMTTKSGIMLGLRETYQEVVTLFDDLLSVGCKIITIGQYLQPTSKNVPVYDFISDEQFNEYRKVALTKGFKFVESSSLVRSSYHAEKHINKENFLQIPK